jgi:hypothetical protein
MSLEEIYSQPRAATIVSLSTLTLHQAWFAVLGQHSYCFMCTLVMYPCHVFCIQMDPQGAGQGSKLPSPETGRLWLFVTEVMHVAVKPLLLMLHAVSASFAAYLAMQCMTCDILRMLHAVSASFAAHLAMQCATGGMSLVVPDQPQGVVAITVTNCSSRLPHSQHHGCLSGPRALCA